MKWLSRTFRAMVKVTFTSKYAFPCPNSSIKFNAFHWNYCCVCVCVYIYIYILCYILWPPALHADTLLSEPPEKPYISQFSSVQSLTHVWLFVTPWIEARQASLSITNSRSLLKLMPIKSVMPSSHLIFCHPLSSCPQSLPASGSFPMSQLFTWGGQSTGVSASASVLPLNTQDWSPSGWTGWISLQSKGLSRVFSNTTIQYR